MKKFAVKNVGSVVELVQGATFTQAIEFGDSLKQLKWSLLSVQSGTESALETSLDALKTLTGRDTCYVVSHKTKEGFITTDFALAMTFICAFHSVDDNLSYYSTNGLLDSYVQKFEFVMFTNN